ncbi:MAG: hypothetical protein HZB53_21865 [Chloroflexi bacterium]|nr:hypothetical protein [Chloroflexota bacterium]
MPYQPGKYLPGERASKLGHLEVLQSPLVQQLVKNFQLPEVDGADDKTAWQPFPSPGQPFDLLFAVDGSLQVIVDERPPHKAVAFVKTALMRIDQVALGRISKDAPHPFELRDLMAESALFHATAFPLRHVTVPGMSVFDAIRRIVFESFKDSTLNGEPYETFKWLVYEKWSGGRKELPDFECPHCGYKNATLSYDSDEGACSRCGGQLLVTDMLGFHQDMVEDSASDSVATAYMSIHETLLLFTGVRHFWQTSPDVLKRCLFIKDGPLSIRAQYSKLVAPIRRLLTHALSSGNPIYLVSQEKTGLFVDQLELVGRDAPVDHLFVPDHDYICEQIQHRPSSGAAYGKDTNYGAKVFVRVGERHRFVLNIPVSSQMSTFIKAPDVHELIGIDRILATLPKFLSSQYENALLPIQLANSIASLSTYPSAQVLKLFADATMKGPNLL